MGVITNTTLVIRRIADLQRRRSVLVERQQRLRDTLPEWTLAPLQLAGMSTRELEGFVAGLTSAEQEAGLDEVEEQIDELDHQIEELENTLLTTPAPTLDNVVGVLEIALERVRAQTPSDPGDIFFDYGDARVLRFLERVYEDLSALLHDGQRTAS
jgi:hypothetical protein